jgi:energy-coupling factor transporter transmembrane protein EcfT
LYEDRDRSLEEGRGQRFLYDLPIILQSLTFITFIILIFFGKNVGLGKYLENSHMEKWGWWLILTVFSLGMMVFLPDLVKKKWKRGWFFTVAVLSALLLMSIHFPISYLLTPSRSAYPVSGAIHALVPPNQEVIQYQLSLYGIDFYNKIRTPLVGHGGEMEFGLRQLPPDERSRYYLSNEEFFARCKESGDIYCITRHKRNVEALKSNVSALEILWNNGIFYLLRLRWG